jgi:putative FmdB family regulatory protein
MPIYEYHCKDCGLHFEKFVRSISGAVVVVECPQCHSKNCEKSISLFGMASTGGAEASASSCAPSG